MATGVGLATTLIGGALAAAPAGPAGFLRLSSPLGARVIGIADLALVPGLIAGRPRWPWMAGRAALNVAIAAYLLREARLAGGDGGRLRVAAIALLALTVGDVQVTRALRVGARAR